MKQQGFTLAEVLVTLGIIGVVAAMTTPALIQNVNNSKVGPKLAKAKASLENASNTLLATEEMGTLWSVADDAQGLGDALRKYIKWQYVGDSTSITLKDYSGSDMSKRNRFRYDSIDGVSYLVYKRSTSEGAGILHPNAYYDDIPSNQEIGSVQIDINGNDSGPNRMGKDIFHFIWYNDGTLRPLGARGGRRSSAPGDTPPWSQSGTRCDKQGVEYSGYYCAGSIFENNMKIIYE